MLKINIKNTRLEKDIFWKNQSRVNEIHSKINKLADKQDEFLGWNNWPKKYFNSSEYKKVKEVVNKLNEEEVDTLLVIGIGGSYLGARAGIDFVLGLFPSTDKKVYFTGINISPLYLNQIRKKIEKKNWAILIISKSGTTLEPALAFRILRDDLIKKVGLERANKVTIAITDESKGTLKELSIKNKFDTFIIPDNVGGRYSVLTPVGLVPLLFSGIDIDKLFSGAQKAYDEMSVSDIAKNSAYKYAVSRYELSKRYSIELFSSYEPNMQYFIEWWKQLYGESEGKDSKGLFPASAIFSSDLHSLGQYIQEGKKLLFETVLWIKNSNSDIKIPESKGNEDNLNYIANKSMHWVNQQAFKGVVDAHYNIGEVENILLEIDNMSSETLGYLFYFFMKACAMSAYLLGVDPFNQPGVEEYKKSMFKLLGK